MRPSDVIWLLLLSALWGAAFIFLRIASPVVDPGWIAFLRTGLAALTVIAYTAVMRLPLLLRQRWWPYLIVGVLNASFPWLLYSHASKHLPASYMVMLNTSTPMFVLLLAMANGSEAVDRWKLLGLVLGVVGVSLIVGLGPLQLSADVALAVLMSLMSAFCYALGGVAMRRYGKNMDSSVLTAGSMLVAAFVLLPAVGPMPQWANLSAAAAGAIAALGIGCSGIGYLIYYRMVARVGPTRSLTVTYLMPLFGTFYGVALLGEPFGAGIAIGGLTVLLATALVTGVLGRRY